MAATALLKFSQGPLVGADGRALKGVIGTPVMVQNSVNTDVASWQIDLVYVDPASAVVPATPYAFNDNGNTPTATFTPDVRGSYRFVLKVWGAPGRVGNPTSVDIRIFAVPEINGFVVPAAQLWPRPLPPIGSGDPTAKPSEFNFDGQGFGWAGDGADDGLLNSLVRRVDSLTSATSVQEAVPVLSNGQTLFTLSRPTTSDSTVVMYINGSKAVYGSDYTANGTTVTYTGPLSLVTTDIVEFWYIVGGQFVGNNSSRQESLPVTLVGQTTFTLSETPTSAATVEMFVNSAKMQYGVDYSVVGDTVSYTGSISLQVTDVVEFWYVIGPIVAGSNEPPDFLPDPDTAGPLEKLQIFGAVSPKSVIQRGQNLWVVDQGDSQHSPSSLIRYDLASRRPKAVARAGSLGPVWKAVAFATDTSGVILVDDAGSRYLLEVSVSGEDVTVDTDTPYVIGPSTGTDLLTDPWHPYSHEAPLFFAGGYYWTITATDIIRVDPLTLGEPSTVATLMDCRWLVYDADITHYTDNQPRLWALLNVVNPVVLRIEVTGFTIDSSVFIFSGDDSTATQILIGGNKLFVVGFDGASADHIGRVDLSTVTLDDVGAIPSIEGPLSAVYDNLLGRLIVTSIGSGSTNYVISRVNPTTLVTEQTVAGSNLLYTATDALIPYALFALGSAWIPDIYASTIRQVTPSSLAISNLHPRSLEYQSPNYANNLFFLDPNATYSYAFGSSENPYKKISDALRIASGASTLVLARGDYTVTDPGPVASLLDLNVVGRGDPSLTVIPSISAPGTTASFQNVTVDSITAGSVILDNCVIASGATITATTVQLQNTVSNATTFTTSNLYLDSVSAYWFDTNGSTVSGVRTLLGAGISVTVPNGSPVTTTSAIVPPGCSVSNGVLSLFRGGQNVSNVTLSLNGSTSVLPIVFSGLDANRHYNCTFGYRCVIWPSATRANVGSMDCVVDLYIVTNGLGVATVTVQTTPTPDVSRLPAAISTATTTVSASAGGVTIYASRPTGVACLVRAKWWVVEFEDIT